MTFLKKHWKNILIAILAVLFLSKCVSSGNYERKYKKEVQRTDFVTDSLKEMFSKSSSMIDSLNVVISKKDIELASKDAQLSIYQEQNAQLNDRNKQLSGKQVIVSVPKGK